MLNDGAVCQVTAVASAAGLAASSFFAFKKGVKPTAARFASVTALVFAAQMMNFPVQSGTSGHLIGATLALMLLGIPHAVLSMSIVLAVQCLVFADGGLDVLGANILNMAVVAVIPGAFAKLILDRKKSISVFARGAVIISASWFSVLLASFACSIELSSAGTIPASVVIPAMTGIHALIGIGEGVITFAAVLAFGPKASAAENTSEPLRAPGSSYKTPLASAALIALVLSPFASSYPDGLEWVAERLGFLHESMPLFVSPMSDYAVPFIGNEALSTSLAGISGTVIVFVFSYLAGIVLDRPPARTGYAG